MRNKLLLIIGFLCGCFFASAQESETPAPSASAEDSIVVFHPHGYVEGLIGVQQTLGEIRSLSLNDLNLQVGGGYNFTPVWGLRLTVGGWQSKGGMVLNGENNPYRWYYVAPTLNVTADLTNAIWGYKEDRVVSWNVFAGPGMNIAFKNDEAIALNQRIIEENPVLGNGKAPLDAVWDGAKVFALGQFGTNVWFRVSERVRLGVEGNINFVDDRYNSKYVNNIDWYFNFLAGVKVLIGKTHEKQAKPKQEPELLPETAATDTVAAEEPVDRENIDALNGDPNNVEVKNADALPSIGDDRNRVNIFFLINSHEVRQVERTKVEQLNQMLAADKNIKVSLYGYADSQTGTPAVNKRIASERVHEVTRILVNEYHIAPNRIEAYILGDTEQPFAENDLNRVVICIVDEVK